MSALAVSGPGSFDLLQFCFTKDFNHCVGKNAEPLIPGRCVYGAFLNDKGHVIDDAIVYYIGPHNYMVVVNAGTGAVIADHLKCHSDKLDVAISDLTGQVGKLDIQGPASAKILMRILKNSREMLKDMQYFSFKGRFDESSAGADALLEDGTSILLSRTGYTGEFGFELFVHPERLAGVWESILAAGAEFGLIPCGLAARDSLRAGAVLPLSHQDIGPWPFINHPWPFALPYNQERTAFTKRFIGDNILTIRKNSEYTHAFVGYDPRKVSTHDPAVVIDSHDTEIGVVLTCVADMAIGRHDGRIYSMATPNKPENFKPRGLSCGFVRVKHRLVPNQDVELKDNRRSIKVTIVDDIRPDRTARHSIKVMMGALEPRP
jgi:aminomethyltransferase